MVRTYTFTANTIGTDVFIGSRQNNDDVWQAGAVSYVSGATRKDIAKDSGSYTFYIAGVYFGTAEERAHLSSIPIDQVISLTLEFDVCSNYSYGQSQSFQCDTAANSTGSDFTKSSNAVKSFLGNSVTTNRHVTLDMKDYGFPESGGWLIRYTAYSYLWIEGAVTLTLIVNETNTHTYTLTPTAMYTGFKRRGGYHHANWDNIEVISNTNAQRKVGDNGDTGGILWTSIFFDPTILTYLYSCTIKSITLQFIYNSTDNNGNIAIRYKNSSSTTDWTSSNSSQTEAGTYNIATTIASSSPQSFTLTNVPKYGLVVGPNGTPAVNNNWIRIATSSTLVIVTEEYDQPYVLEYNANGGAGAPAAQSGTNQLEPPSYTFTISSSIPARLGYEFLGWALSSSASSATYQPGDTLTVSTTGITTLYAVWKALNTIKIVNSNNELDIYLVYIIENGDLVPYQVNIVDSNNNLIVCT